ncbi:MAG: hypothetical protein LKE40_11215 [Spirochaetia bacterium]|jgi:hypothetical protein|nr:hypothetical protein [Spirochaetia bacterium]
MNLLIIALSKVDYKEDVFLALQSVGITKASTLDAENLSHELGSEFSLFTGFFQGGDSHEGEKLIILAPIDSPDDAAELLSNLEAGGIPVKEEDILDLFVVPLGLYFDQEKGLKKK